MVEHKSNKKSKKDTNNNKTNKKGKYHHVKTELFDTATLIPTAISYNSAIIPDAIFLTTSTGQLITTSNVNPLPSAATLINDFPTTLNSHNVTFTTSLHNEKYENMEIDEKLQVDVEDKNNAAANLRKEVKKKKKNFKKTSAKKEYLYITTANNSTSSLIENVNHKKDVSSNVNIEKNSKKKSSSSSDSQQTKKSPTSNSDYKPTSKQSVNKIINAEEDEFEEEEEEEEFDSIDSDFEDEIIDTDSSNEETFLKNNHLEHNDDNDDATSLKKLEDLQKLPIVSNNVFINGEIGTISPLTKSLIDTSTLDQNTLFTTTNFPFIQSGLFTTTSNVSITSSSSSASSTSSTTNLSTPFTGLTPITTFSLQNPLLAPSLTIPIYNSLLAVNTTGKELNLSTLNKDIFQLTTAAATTTTTNQTNNQNKVKNTKNSKTNSQNMTTSRGRKRTAQSRLPAKLKEPAAVARRNARERKRVKMVNDGFLRLRRHVPTDPKNKKLSKVKTLRLAIEYIHHLQQLLQADVTAKQTAQQLVSSFTQVTNSYADLDSTTSSWLNSEALARVNREMDEDIFQTIDPARLRTTSYTDYVTR